MPVKSLAIMGSTGSVGQNSLEVVRQFPNQFRVGVLSAHKNLPLLKDQINQFKPTAVVLTDIESFEKLSIELKGDPIKVYNNFDSLKELLEKEKIDLLVNALPSIYGGEVSLQTLNCGIDLALANKESLLLNGPQIIRTAKQKNAQIIPIDSEASAIHQCLMGEESTDVERIYLTASGGPIYQKGLNIQDVKRAEILDHPVWKMGEKISVDSASMMNKAFEAYEIHQLFNVPLDKITVIIHPEAHVHSMVQFKDGQIKLLASTPDMKIPIAHALFYPDRSPLPLNKKEIFPSVWKFEPLNHNDFPCFQMAMNYLNKGGQYPSALLIVNDFFVNSYLNRKLEFNQLCETIDHVISTLSLNEKESFYSISDFVKECEEQCRLTLK